MTRTADVQARQLLRLRAARLEGAARALEASRALTRAAEAAEREAQASAERAADLHQQARHDLAADPQEAERLLALSDKARFAQAVAANLAVESADALAEQQRDEAERRRSLIHARLRHERLTDRIGIDARRAARRAEDLAAEL